MGLFNNFPYTNFHELNLDWVLSTVKRLSEEWTATHDDLEGYAEYITDYFANLNVQDEIDNKLDTMAEDGSLGASVTPYVDDMLPNIVSSWLRDNITPTTPAVDASLTVSGAAADAAVTGAGLYLTKDRTANTPAALTWWNSASAGFNDTDNPVAPQNMPVNTYTYALANRLAGFSNDLFTMSGSAAWYAFCVASLYNPQQRIYILIRRSTATIAPRMYIGTSINGGNAVIWADYSPSTATTPSVKLAMFGDSIMRGIINTSGGGTANNDDNIPNGVAAELNIAVGNFGIGSIGWLNNGGGGNKTPAYDYLKAFVAGTPLYYGNYPGAGSAYDNYKFIGRGTLSDYNAIVLAFGANDRGYSLGSLEAVKNNDSNSSYDPDTVGYSTSIAEQVYRCVRYLRTQVPNIPIILAGPYISCFGGNVYGNGDYDNPGTGGWSKREYAQFLQDFARYYGCGYYDNEKMPRYPYDLTQSLTANVHPTQACYHELGKYTAGVISGQLI